MCRLILTCATQWDTTSEIGLIAIASSALSKLRSQLLLVRLRPILDCAAHRETTAPIETKRRKDESCLFVLGVSPDYASRVRKTVAAVA